MALLRFIAFAVVRAWQGFWRNAMMSLAATSTVVLMLVLLSGLFIVLGGLNSGLEFIESKVGVTARLIDDLPPEEVDALVADIEAMPGVQSVEYVSPEVALDRLKEAYREQGLELDLGGAPISLYASVEIDLIDPTFANSVQAALQDRPMDLVRPRADGGARGAHLLATALFCPLATVVLFWTWPG